MPLKERAFRPGPNQAALCFRAYASMMKSKTMKIRQIIEMINRMAADGVIARYAIGGAVGATFYLEPVATLDIDVFVAFPPGESGLIVDPDPIFDYLKARGGVPEGEFIKLGEWPVQFLPAGNSLIVEALETAVVMDVEGIPARVFTAEHLAAIALQTGRPKDKARLLQFLEAESFDRRRFADILDRHLLGDAWARFKRQFLDE